MLSSSTHVFSEIYIHLTWHCKNDRCYLKPGIQKSVNDHIENYCAKSKGIRFLGIGGTEDHIHLVIQIEPSVCLGDWVGKIKGASSHEINKRSGSASLYWQRGYGAVSFAKRDLKAVLHYVADQARRHSTKRVNAVLEMHGTYQEEAVKSD